MKNIIKSFFLSPVCYLFLSLLDTSFLLFLVISLPFLFELSSSLHDTNLYVLVLEPPIHNQLLPITNDYRRRNCRPLVSGMRSMLTSRDVDLTSNGWSLPTHAAIKNHLSENHVDDIQINTDLTTVDGPIRQPLVAAPCNPWNHPLWKFEKCPQSVWWNDW